MLNSVLASFYERDLRKLIEEINLFRNEEDVWRTQGSVKNSAGNLALHLIGGLNYLIGASLRTRATSATATWNLPGKVPGERNSSPSWNNLF